MFQILSVASAIPIFGFVSPTAAFYTADFVYLTVYGYLGIGILSLSSLCIAEPVSDQVVSEKIRPAERTVDVSNGSAS